MSAVGRGGEGGDSGSGYILVAAWSLPLRLLIFHNYILI